MITALGSTVAETVFKSSTQQPIFAASNPVVDSGTPYLQLPSGLNNVFNSWPESAYTCTWLLPPLFDAYCSLDLMLPPLM